MKGTTGFDQCCHGKHGRRGTPHLNLVYLKSLCSDTAHLSEAAPHLLTTSHNALSNCLTSKLGMNKPVSSPGWHLYPQNWLICAASVTAFSPGTFYLFIFRERGREGERAGEKHQYERDTSVGFLLHTPTRDLASKPVTCPVWEPNQKLLKVWRMTPNSRNHTHWGCPGTF